jgi:putative nucleotidyltransferase with HDIG domain
MIIVPSCRPIAPSTEPLKSMLDRSKNLALVDEFVTSDSLKRHMLAVEAAMRAYAEKLGEDVELWGAVGLLHDFDYERWPNPPDHPLQGSVILRERGYSEEIIRAILSHADYLSDQYPRQSRLEHALYACDELCGFLTACAMVRPQRLEGITASSVRKKLKNLSFAAAVNREDIARGAEAFGVDVDEHIEFCAGAMHDAKII